MEILVFRSKNVRCSLKGDQKYARPHTTYPQGNMPE